MFIVDRLLPIGLNLLCGSSKIGKSWLVLDLAISVAKGNTFLGFNTSKSSVLYYALEDTKNRLYERGKILLNGSMFPSNLYGSTYAINLSCGFLNNLENELNNNPDIKLVIVDTLQKIRGKINQSETAYAYDYREMSELKRFADLNGICMLLIHHTRKAQDSDIYNTINGTTGLIGTSDNTFILSKDNRMDNKAILSITGRDIENEEYVLEFNSKDCKWNMISKLRDYELKEENIEFNNSLVMREVLSIKRPISTTATELSELIEREYNINLEPYTIGLEINKYEKILEDKYHIKHINKRTSAKRIHTFIDV